VLFLTAFTLVANAESPWALLVEPSFTDAAIRRPIANSQRTILVVARVVDGEIQPLTREEKRSIPGTFGEIQSAALESASVILANITPTYVRDKNGVIEYAVLRSDNPLTASTVLAPDFQEKFASTIGPDLLVAMPSRFEVFVFSKQDTTYRRMNEAIIAGYLEATYPVSREIFALEAGRLRSLGVYQ